MDAPQADATASASAPSDEQQVNPPDFKGEVETNNDLPSQVVLRAVENYTVIDSAGKFHAFRSLYSGPNVARRILVIFVRHFFCGVSVVPPLLSYRMSFLVVKSRISC